MTAKEYFKALMKTLQYFNTHNMLMEKISEYQQAVIRYCYYSENICYTSNYLIKLASYITELEEDSAVEQYIKNITDEWFIQYFKQWYYRGENK